jgi:hypothetical protein
MFILFTLYNNYNEEGLGPIAKKLISPFLTDMLKLNCVLVKEVNVIHVGKF